MGLVFGGYPLLSAIAAGMGIEAMNSRTISIPYRGIVLALSLILSGYALFINGLYGKRSLLLLLFCAFWILYTARLVCELFIMRSPTILPWQEYLLQAFAVTIGCSLFMFSKWNIRVFQAGAFWIWIFSLAAIVVILAVGELPVEQNRRFETALLVAIGYGQCAVTLILLSMHLALRAKSMVAVGVYLVAIVPAVKILLVSASRSPFISLTVGMALVFYVIFKERRKWWILVFVLVTMFAACYYAFAFDSEQSYILTRFNETANSVRQGEGDERLEIWSAAVNQYMQNPYFGNGIEIFGYGYPHNLVLEALMVCGPVGLGLMLLIQLGVLSRVPALLRCVEVRWVALLVAQFFILALFSGGLYCSPQFWGVILLVIASRGALQNRVGLIENVVDT